MLHIVPILCLLLFIGFIEYRLKKHLDITDNDINNLRDKIAQLEFNNMILTETISDIDESLRNE